MTRPLHNGWDRVGDILMAHPTTLSWLFVCAEFAAAWAGKLILLALLMAMQLTVIMFVVNTFYGQAKKARLNSNREGPDDEPT